MLDAQPVNQTRLFLVQLEENILDALISFKSKLQIAPAPRARANFEPATIRSAPKQNRIVGLADSFVDGLSAERQNFRGLGGG